MPLIDVHQHVIPDFYKAELARVGVLGSGENPWPAWSMKRQLELMDELGIDAVLLSIASPGAWFGDVVQPRAGARLQRMMARVVADHPENSAPWPSSRCRTCRPPAATWNTRSTRSSSTASICRPTPRTAISAIPEEDELYAELDRRKAVVFVHPQRPPVKDMPHYSFPPAIPNSPSTPRAPSPISLYNGTLAKFPNIRWIMPHMGGVTPFCCSGSRIEDDPKAREKVPEGVATLSQPALLRRRPIAFEARTATRCSNSPTRRAFCSAPIIRPRARPRKSCATRSRR